MDFHGCLCECLTFHNVHSQGGREGVAEIKANNMTQGVIEVVVFTCTNRVFCCYTYINLRLNKQMTRIIAEA